MSRVLIIEDSPTETPVYRRLLEKHGFAVLTPGKGGQGIQSALQSQPELILMALMRIKRVLAGVNGFQTTREIQQNQDMAGIPVIMKTTRDQDTDRIWGMRQGAVDYMVKPVKKTPLLVRVKASLVNRPAVGLAINENPLS